jgi:uncharacterized protein YjbJ (UPF0337 family)
MSSTHDKAEGNMKQAGGKVIRCFPSYLRLFDNFGRSKRRLDMRLETKREAEGKSKNLEGKVEHKIGEVKAVVGK